MPGPLIAPEELAAILDTVTILDIRWELATGPDHAAYLGGHIPGAVFVDLEHQLADPPSERGRHPLPEPARFTQEMRSVGVSDRRLVVVYDGRTSLAAARAWWLLRYFGHADTRVLDGGLRAWAESGHPLARDEVVPAPGDFSARPGGMPILSADQAQEIGHRGILLDARAEERYLGRVEPIDPIAGHIPGARNRPTTANLDADGRFLGPTVLRQEFERLGVRPETRLGTYCGSGITAAHETLALELAGYRAALYPGSWSEWVTDPGRPVATGREPG